MIQLLFRILTRKGYFSHQKVICEHFFYFVDKYCHSLTSYTRYQNTIFNSFLSYSRNYLQKSTMYTKRKLFFNFFLSLFSVLVPREGKSFFQFYYIFISSPSGGTKGTSNSNVWRFTNVLRQLKIEVHFSRRTLAIFCIVINVLYINSSTWSAWNQVTLPL